MVEKSCLFLFLAIVGIFSLLILSKTLEPPLTTMNHISEKDINQHVKVQAAISSIITPKNQDFQILTLEDKTGNLTAISNSISNLKSNKSKVYFFTGKIQEYTNEKTNKSELQLNINKIQDVEA